MTECNCNIENSKSDPKAIWRCINCGGDIKKFDSSDANMGSTKKGYAVGLVHSKDIWNAAIEAAANKAEANGTMSVAMEIRKLKK